MWCSAIADVAARLPVVGASSAGEVVLAQTCEGGVQAAAFLPGQEGVERLGLEGVVEPVAAIGRRVEDAGVDGLPQQPRGVRRGGAREVHRPLEGPPLGRLAADRHREDQLARLDREMVPGAEHGPAQVVGHLRTQVPGRRRHAFDEEPVEVRVSTGTGVHVGDERLVGRGAEQGVQLVTGLAAVEGRERQLGEGRHPAHVGQPSLNVVARTDLTPSEGEQDGQPTVDRPREEVHEGVERPLVGPLEVVDDQDHGAAVGAGAVDPLVEVGRPGTALGADRQRRCAEVVGEPAQCGAQREERHADRAEGQARHRDQHVSVLSVGTGPFDEAGLSDPRVPDDEECAGPARTGVLDRGADPAHLPGPTDEPPAGGRLDRCGHPRKCDSPSPSATRRI